MSDERPSPDELLARVQADDSRAQRGRLKVFFGYAAGVGKTFAMLEAAQRERTAGVVSSPVMSNRTGGARPRRCSKVWN